MLEKGTKLAGYRIDSVLGQGGMGTVYEATQLSLDRVVALKVLAGHLSDDLVFRERFRREGQIQARLEHAHIVTVYEAGESELGLFIAMRLVRGRTLKDMILARELDAGRSLRILAPLAEALDDAHALGLIHRDIKPQNILVGGRDHAYLADFGLTKGTSEKSLTKSGFFVGTIDYIAPEQIEGKSATPATDVYALAAVLYECLTGVVPYPKESEAAVLYAHMADDPPRLSDQRPELPQQLDKVIARAMAKDPAQRHATATQLIEEVGRAFSRRTRAAISPPGPIEVPEETGIRKAEDRVSTFEKPVTPVPETAIAAAAAPETEAAATAPPREAFVGTAPKTAPPREALVDTGVPTAPPREAILPTRAGAAPPPETLGQPTAVGDTPGAGTSTRVPPRPPATTTRDERTAAPPPARGTPAAVLFAGIVALAALAAAGLLAGRSLSGDEAATPAATRAVDAGPVGLQVPASWTETPAELSIPGLRFEDATTLTPAAGANAGSLTAGRVNATGPALLPSAFIKSVGGAPDPETVALGDLQAYRYSDLRPKGFDQRLDVYTVPTTEGVTTVACAAPAAGAADVLAACDRAAASMKLESGEPFELGRDEAYDRTLTRTFAKLNRTRKREVRELRRAKTPSAQARHADALARAYASAAAPLAKASLSPAFAGANDELVAALRSAAGAYRRMAAAARHDNGAAYNRARADVARADAAIGRALAGLKPKENR